jgi:hypothetical protein
MSPESRPATRAKAQGTASATTHLDDLGKRLHELLKSLPDHDAITDTLDYLVGALYGLKRAVDLGFVDRRGPSHPTYRPFLTTYALDIVATREVHRLWLAGFYFNSGIQRIAASYDRIPKLLDARGDRPSDRMKNAYTTAPEEWHSVYREVNFFKHDPEGRAKGRQVTMDVALRATDQAITLVEKHVSQLVTRYSPPRPN